MFPLEKRPKIQELSVSNIEGKITEFWLAKMKAIQVILTFCLFQKNDESSTARDVNQIRISRAVVMDFPKSWKPVPHRW